MTPADPHPRRVIPALLAALLLTGPAPAAEDGDGPTVGALDDADRATLVTAAREYGECLRGEAGRLAPEHQDVRALLEAASAPCQGRLERLEGDLEAGGLTPQAAAGFTRRIRGRTVRRLLPQIMSLLAGRPGE